MYYSAILVQLTVLAATALAYRCNSYAFPLRGARVHGENTTNAVIKDKSPAANLEGMGSAHIWGSPGGPVPWERDENNLFTIHYCFIRDYDREHIGHTFEAAVEEWWNEIGKAGPRSGHGLAMEEVVDEDGNPVYCMDSSQEDKWNKKIPYDTLPVEFTDGREGSCSSTIGLQRTFPSTHWNMRLSIDAPHLIQDTMHELGHVFGMEHEHQRSDRNKYIQVVYSNLWDHRSCYRKAKLQEPHLTEDELCLDFKKAAKYGCGCREYIKGVSINGERIKAGSNEFDFKSIMMYNTVDNAKGNCPDKLEECPLVRWKDPEDHSKGIARVQNLRGVVSDLDFSWVKSTYPWKQPPERP